MWIEYSYLTTGKESKVEEIISPNRFLDISTIMRWSPLQFDENEEELRLFPDTFNIWREIFNEINDEASSYINPFDVPSPKDSSSSRL